MTVRELAKLARYVIQTYPDFYKLICEREFTWNKIRQQNRNPLRPRSRRRRAETGYTKGGWLGMVGSAVKMACGLSLSSTVSTIPTIAPPKSKKMLAWGYAIEARTLFAAQQPSATQVFGGESRSVKLASPNDQGDGTKNAPTKCSRAGLHGPVRARSSR